MKKILLIVTLLFIFSCNWFHTGTILSKPYYKELNKFYLIIIDDKSIQWQIQVSKEDFDKYKINDIYKQR